MGYGLPYEYRTPDGEHEDWEAAHGYLKALEESGRPVVVAIVDPRRDKPSQRKLARVTEQIGFLRELAANEDRPTVHRFALNWPDANQPCGEFRVDKRLFEGARLSTNDGDTYFGLKLDLGALSILVMYTNLNMDHAVKLWSERRQGYLTLLSPITAKELEERGTNPDPDVVAAISRELVQLRADLAEHGARAAENMSDDELLVAGRKVAWNLRSRKRFKGRGRSAWPKLWFEGLVAELREEGGSGGRSR